MGFLFSRKDGQPREIHQASSRLPGSGGPGPETGSGWAQQTGHHRRITRRYRTLGEALWEASKMLITGDQVLIMERKPAGRDEQ